MSQFNGLMKGKRGLIMGVANDHSIAWGIAQTLHQHGAELAFTYQGDAFGKRVKPLVETVGAKIVIEADVENDQSLETVFSTLEREWGSLDFVVHAIAFSDRNELKGRYVDTSRANFRRSMEISCFSFTDIARRAQPLMKNGGSLITEETPAEASGENEQEVVSYLENENISDFDLNNLKSRLAIKRADVALAS
jgi:enoyl-[acyl-carrier protein] reductase I